MVMTARLKTALWLLAGIVACLLLTAYVYWSGLRGAFALDDGANIIYPYEYVKDPTWESVSYVVTHNGSGVLGRSVSVISFILTGLQYGLDAWGYKYHNLLLHLLNGVLLFYLLQQILPLLDRRLDQNRALWIAGVVSALWLLHPLQVSTVLYAVQRMTQLAALFTLLALLAYVKARLNLAATYRFYLYGWVLLPLFAVLAVLSKENGALIPVYILIIECLAFRPDIPELRANRRLGVFLGVFIAAPLLLASLALVFEFDALTNYNSRTFTLGERVLTQVHALFFYIRMILLPRMRDMSLFHDDYAVVHSPGAVTLVLIAALVLIAIAIWRLRRTLPVVSFGLAWFFASHLMESTIFPLEMVFEHRNYLAVAGLMLVPVHALFLPATAAGLRWLCVVAVAGFSFMTATRAAEWGDTELFYRVAVTEHPGSPRAVNTYLNYLLGENRFKESVVLLERQVIMTPEEAGAWLHLQVVLCPLGTRNSAALQKSRDLLGSAPASVYALNGLQSLMTTVVDEDCTLYTLDEVEALIDEALEYTVEHTHTQNRAFLLRMRAIVAFHKGFYAQGYGYFRMAHELTPDIDLLAELAKYQVDMGQVGDAEQTLELMEEQNARRFGIDGYQLTLSRQMIESARAAADQREQAPAAQ
jgi:tetratricopeptide (TPR) repeat protein